MPIYPIVCGKCHFHGDTFAKVAEIDPDGCILCPECGTRAPQDYTRKSVGNGNREFHGKTQESITEWFHPTEVAEARRTFGDRAGACIQDNGTVRFKDRSQQREYAATRHAIEAKAQTTKGGR
jgi:hypothetical protein